MRTAFHESIDEVFRSIVEMMGLVGIAVAQATEALLTGDDELALQVIAQDDDIDELYQRLELRVHELLATQAPVAGDLRALIAVARIIGDVERAGDLAQNIAKAARRLRPLDLPEHVATVLREMGRQGCLLMQRAAEAVRDREPDAAERLDLMDDVMDDLRREMFALLARPGPGADVELAMRLSLVTRHYERIADHAVAIAERVEFLVTGSAHESHVGL